jgi:hypothetical protein
MGQLNHDTGTPRHIKVFDTITQDEDLTSEENAPGMEGKFARWIDIATPGTLVVVNGPAETEETLPPLPAGHRIFGQFSGIKLAGTDAEGIIVSW